MAFVQFTPTSNLVVFLVKKFIFFVDGASGHNLVVPEHRLQLKIAIVLSVYVLFNNVVIYWVM